MSAGVRDQAALRGLVGLGGLGAVLCAGLLLMQGIAVPLAAEQGQERLEQAFAAQAAQHREGLSHLQKPVKSESHVALSPVRITALPAPGAVTAVPGLLRLSVPRLGVHEIATVGTATHDELANGPVIVKRASTQSPVTILAAHRDTHFLFVRDLTKGDVIELAAPSGQRASFRVVRFETVRWDRFAYPRDPAHPLLLLVTCYPFGGTEYGGPLRRIVWAERIRPTRKR